VAMLRGFAPTRDDGEPSVSAVPTNLCGLHSRSRRRTIETLRVITERLARQRQERPEVRVTVRRRLDLYTNVALHLKGAAGSFRPFDDKPALTLHSPNTRRASGSMATRRSP